MRLKFWLRGSLEVFGLSMGITVMFIVMMWLQSVDMRLADIVYLLPLYMMLSGALVNVIMMTAGFRQWMSLTLSMGSTRRETFWGFQIIKLLPAALIAATAAAMLGFMDMFRELRELLPFAVAFVFGSAAVGGIVGLVGYRFGKVGTIVSVAALALSGMGLGVTTAMTIDGEAMEVVGALGGIGAWGYAALAAACVLIAVGMLIERPVIRRFEARL